MARTPFVSGNWKMFTNAQSGKALAAAVGAGLIGIGGGMVLGFLVGVH